MAAALAHVAQTGTLVYVGITTQELKFPHAPVFHRREITLMASRNALPKDFGEIIGLIGEGKIDTDAWITHRLAFADVPSGFARFTDPKLGAIKVIIDL